jgi:hypothetical protein
MSFPSFAHQIIQLGAEHNRADFHSGSKPLDRYLRERADRDFKRYVATSFVLYDADAIRRGLMNEIVAAAVVVDAKDDAARSFYEYHNFIALAE